MEQSRKLFVIINPISGTSNKEYLPEMIAKTLGNKGYKIKIRFTNFAGHAAKLAQRAIREEYYGVLAIGGDGTINEIASKLRDSQVALGIKIGRSHV